jgi:hypothetical protein
VEWPIIGRTALVEDVADRILERRSVLLEGALGVGKTVLSALIVERLQRDGWHADVCVATAPEAAIPFGAFSRFLPPAPSGDLALTLEQARRRVLGAAAGRPSVLLVDDVHNLDPGSLALVGRLARAGDLPVLLTYRAGEALDASVIDLQQRGLLERIEVPPLDRASVASLLAAAFGAEPAARVADRIWALTKGNPLFLRELVSQTLERGAVSSDDVADIMALPTRVASSPGESVGSEIADEGVFSAPVPTGAVVTRCSADESSSAGALPRTRRETAP